jgi:hypothetical protein
MLRPPDAARFFTFLAVMASTSLCLTSLFRLIAVAVPTPPLVNAVSGILLLLLIVTSGFTIGAKWAGLCRQIDGDGHAPSFEGHQTPAADAGVLLTARSSKRVQPAADGPPACASNRSAD